MTADRIARKPMARDVSRAEPHGWALGTLAANRYGQGPYAIGINDDNALGD